MSLEGVLFTNEVALVLFISSSDLSRDFYKLYASQDS